NGNGDGEILNNIKEDINEDQEDTLSQLSRAFSDERNDQCWWSKIQRERNRYRKERKNDKIAFP
ncbi:13638_t:CDS:1, partial [Ambispora gerdemannii]